MACPCTHVGGTYPLFSAELVLGLGNVCNSPVHVGVAFTVPCAVQLTVALATVYPVLHTTSQVDETLRSESHVDAVMFICVTVIAVQLSGLCTDRHVGTAVYVLVAVQFIDATLAAYPELHTKVHAAAPTANTASSHVEAVKFMFAVVLAKAAHV